MSRGVLFVCLGNICRSPLAHGILRARVAAAGLDLRVDSCGTSGYHQGEPPDPRTIAVARRHGIDVSDLRSRRITPADLASGDLIVCMDRSNEQDVRREAPADARIVRFLALVPDPPFADVPDPYYGGADGFEALYALLDAGIDAVAARA